MRIKTVKSKKKTATITFPLTGIKPLYSSSHGRKKKIIFEADVNELKQANKPNTIDEMVAEARLEFYSGKTKGFTSAKKLMAELES